MNNSRTWAIMALDFLADPRQPSQASATELSAIRTRLIHRHIAWLTALRYQLREPSPWENMKLQENVEFRSHYRVQEWEGGLEDEFLDRKRKIRPYEF